MNPSASDVRVRRATVPDVPSMAASRWNDRDAGPADSRLAAYLEGRHHPQQALPPRAAYLAAVNGAVVGYIAGHLTNRYRCEGELQYLYVAPPYRRAGVASTLLRQLAEWFADQGATRICVNVGAESQGAGPFYTRHGAEELRPHWLVWPDVRTILAQPG